MLSRLGRPSLHALPELAARDATQQAALENLSYQVVRFGHDEDWHATIDRQPAIFGKAEDGA